MKNPAAWALDHPHVIWLVTCMALIIGGLSYLDLPRQENPTMPQRFALITTYAPGADPENVELLITKVIEDRVSEVDDIDTIFGGSREGVSTVQVEILKGAPAAERLEEIRRKVQEARADLPPGTLEPQVDTRMLRTNTMILALTGQGVDPLALREQAKTLKRRLELFSSIGRVELLGAVREEILVAVDTRQLAERRLSPASVVASLAERNALVPSGLLELDDLRSPIQTTGSFDRVDQIRQTFLGSAESGLPISLGDVARVERRLEDQKVFVRWNGESAISIALEMQEGRNVIAVGEQVRALIAEMQPEFSEGVRVEIVADEPQYVEERLGKLMGSLQLGLVIVLALSLLGLGWRAGIVIAVSIPISITVAIAGIAYLGLELHQISIAALVIALGLVVDEDIIVVDNIQRHLDQGKSPADAAVDGLGEIHLAVLSGAATTIAAFIPLALMKGDIGDFIRTIPIAVTLMLIASVVVAHFFTPLLTAWLNGIGGARQRRSASRRHPFEPMYRDLLEWMLSHRAVVLVGFAAVFFGSTCGVGSTLWPPDFFNDADRHQFLAMIQLKPGSNVEDTDAAARRVEAYMAKDKRIANWTTYVGTGAPKFYYNQMTEGGGENIAMFVVNTKESVPFDQTRRVAEDLDAALEYEVPGVWLRSFVLKQGYGGGSDIAIFLQGDSIPVLRTLSDRVREIVEKVDGTKNVRDSYGYDPLSLEARVDFAKANQLGISSQDIATTLRIALDGTTATSFREDDEEIAIRVRLDADQRRSVSDLSDVHIYSPRVDAHVPLAQLASIEPVFKTSDIMRWGRKREGGVFADITAERTLMAVAQDVERAVNAGLTIPPGYEISFHGQQTEVTESFVSLARAGIGAIFLIYILLVIQFRTLSQPLLIILAIPMALTGAVWGLAVMGQPLGFMAFLGMISLIGIVVNDSIVLLDYINTLRRRGLQLREATIEGASTRLRAITLTSLTTVGGLLPLSVAGGTLFAPFGWTMIFGMLGSTALTLLVQPVAYMVLETRRSRTWDSAGIDGGQGAVESIGEGLEPAESV